MNQAQARFFGRLLRQNRGIKRIAEIGFNGGHSSFAFLGARRDIEVVSFDLASHTYVLPSKKFIDSRFPGRHTLVIGDSTHTATEYVHRARELGEKPFDLVFIDGGHDFVTAQADLHNMMALSGQNTIVIMDDVVAEGTARPWELGPTQAWEEASSEGLIVPEEIHSTSGHSWATGRYNFLTLG